MSAIVCFALFLGAVIFSLVRGIELVWPVLAGLALFTVRGLCKGYSLKHMARAAWAQERKLLSIIVIFALIGGITAIWRSGGTIAYFIYYGVQFIRPKIFILVAFLLTSALSFTLGTSFGVVGTAGIILMAVARGGGVNEMVTAGAILSGAYFGDRCSPASSSGATVAAVTGTEYMSNVRQMLKTGALPFAVSLGVYVLLSLHHPIAAVDATLLDLLSQHFVLSFWALLPALLMLVLPPVKAPVKWAMGISLTAAKSTAAKGDTALDARWNGDTLSLNHGNVTIRGGKLVYTPADLQMSTPESFSYAMRYQVKEEGEIVSRYFYANVTVVPATVIYYENDFSASAFTFRGSYETVGERDGRVQAEDRPGPAGAFGNTDGDNLYGYDPAYGARPVKRAIQRDLENPIAKLIVGGKFLPGATIKVTAKDGKIVI